MTEKIENIQLNREHGKVERTGTTGGAVETGVEGDADSSTAVTKMAGKFRLDLHNVKGNTPQEKAAEAMRIYQSAENRNGESELVGLYNATADEKLALRELMKKGIPVDLEKDSAQALNSDGETEEQQAEAA